RGADAPLDQQPVSRVAVDVVDERLIDLDGGQRQRAQHGQRRVPGAEVVQIDGHTGVLEAIERGVSAIAAPSVISMRRNRAGRSCSASAASTSSTNVSSANWVGDTLT